MLHSGRMQVESADLNSILFFETPVEVYARVFRNLKPRTPLPEIIVEFRRFANANSTIRLEEGRLMVRITDVLETAPSPVQEALAYILLSKLYRRPVPRVYNHRYRLYLNRKDVRGRLERVRQARGRKFLSGPKGSCHHLEQVFEDLNFRYFHGLMARPELGWSRTRSRTLLGHYDAPHNTIVISRILDDARVPKLALEYVLYHEMLHLRHPVEHRGSRRCVHTPEFQAAEKQFEQLAEAKRLLRRLP